MSRVLLATLTTTLLLAAAPGDDTAKADLDKMQGTWTFTSAEEDGRKETEATLKAQRVVFEKDRYAVRLGERVLEEGTQTLDPSRTPKELDVKILKGKGMGMTQLGIYQLDGDSLKMCFTLPGDKRRPREFIATKGSGQVLIQLKREAR